MKEILPQVTVNKIYQKGDVIKYRTINKCFERNAYSNTTEKEITEEKIGVIEEAFTTIDGTPCYWIKGEKYLLLQTMIIK